MQFKRTTLAPGQRFGRLVLVSEHPERTAASKVRWITRCDCGADYIAVVARLRSGHTSSCGCLRNEISAMKIRAVNTIHGGARSAEYRIWIDMRRRCDQPQRPSFARYGGRGIAICERWQTFENFLDDMGPRPSPAHSIDRIDNDGNYEPGNCRWALPAVQMRNVSTNRLLTHEGLTLTVAEWAERTGIASGSILDRVNRGWAASEALTRPVRSHRRH